MNVDDFFRNYSVLMDNIRLVSASVIKSRFIIKANQSSAITTANKEMIKKDKRLVR